MTNFEKKYALVATHTEPHDSAEDVLRWLVQQVEGDEIEDVTDEMLEKILGGDHGAGTATIFCESTTVLYVLETNREKISLRKQ